MRSSIAFFGYTSSSFNNISIFIIVIKLIFQSQLICIFILFSTYTYRVLCDQFPLLFPNSWTTSCQVGALGAVFWALRRPRWRPPRGPVPDRSLNVSEGSGCPFVRRTDRDWDLSSHWRDHEEMYTQRGLETVFSQLGLIVFELRSSGSRLGEDPNFFILKKFFREQDSCDRIFTKISQCSSHLCMPFFYSQMYDFFVLFCIIVKLKGKGR